MSIFGRMSQIFNCLLVIALCFPWRNEAPTTTWDLSVQTYTFQAFSFVEAVKLAKEAGFMNVEAFHDQKLGGPLQGTFHFGMDEYVRESLKAFMADNQVEIKGYGVVNARSKEEWRRLFEFAHDMGISFLVVEPEDHFLPMIGRLASEFKIQVGIHNHPKPSTYYDPRSVINAIEVAESSFVGACVDIGHWFRSGIDPVMGLQALENHVVSLHFKDLTEFHDEFHHAILGEGSINIPGVITELIRQDFHGNISIEYEHNWADNLGEVTQSLVNLKSMLREMNKKKHSILLN